MSIQKKQIEEKVNPIINDSRIFTFNFNNLNDINFHINKPNYFAKEVIINIGKNLQPDDIILCDLSNLDNYRIEIRSDINNRANLKKFFPNLKKVTIYLCREINFINKNTLKNDSIIHIEDVDEIYIYQLEKFSINNSAGHTDKKLNLIYLKNVKNAFLNSLSEGIANPNLVFDYFLYAKALEENVIVENSFFNCFKHLFKFDNIRENDESPLDEEFKYTWPKLYLTYAVIDLPLGSTIIDETNNLELYLNYNMINVYDFKAFNNQSRECTYFRYNDNYYGQNDEFIDSVTYIGNAFQ